MDDYQVCILCTVIFAIGFAAGWAECKEKYRKLLSDFRKEIEAEFVKDDLPYILKQQVE